MVKNSYYSLRLTLNLKLLTYNSFKKDWKSKSYFLAWSKIKSARPIELASRLELGKRKGGPVFVLKMSLSINVILSYGQYYIDQTFYCINQQALGYTNFYQIFFISFLIIETRSIFFKQHFFIVNFLVLV